MPLLGVLADSMMAGCCGACVRPMRWEGLECCPNLGGGGEGGRSGSKL